LKARKPHDSAYFYAVLKGKVWEKAVRAIVEAKTPERRAAPIATYKEFIEWADRSGSPDSANLGRKWISDFESALQTSKNANPDEA